MSRSVNNVTLLGYIAQPKVHTGNVNVANVSLATNESRKNGGDWEDFTEWHNVTFFGALADVAGKYLKKGSQIYVEGRLHTDSYMKNGLKRYTTKIIASKLIMLGSTKNPDGADYKTPNTPANATEVPF